MQRIGYGPDELSLLTCEGRELLAYDAMSEAPRWALKVDAEIVSISLVDAQALDGAAIVQNAGSPWRSQPSTRAALAIDVDGRLHVVNTTLGTLIGKTDPNGKVIAVATSVVSSAVAIATQDSVLVWRNGVRTSLPIKARALAFSSHQPFLAIGTTKEIVLLDLTLPDPLEHASRKEIGQSIADIDHHDDTWLVCGVRDLFAVNDRHGVEKLPVHGGYRARFDALGKRIAVQHGSQRVCVYEWPHLPVVTRIDYPFRTIEGIAFGPDNWLGVGLDHGDANKIDVETSMVRRTDPHAGREYRSWSLSVFGKTERAAAKDAEEMSRKRAEASSKVGTDSKPFGGRIGVGVLISIALFSVRLCVRTSSSPSHYSSYPTYTIPTPSIPRVCDLTCAKERVERLEKECAAHPGLNCESSAKDARTALSSGSCSQATIALEGIELPAKDHPIHRASPLASSELLLAKLGVKEACSSPLAFALGAKHAKITHVHKSNVESVTESIPEANPILGENVRALMPATDGAIFVATTTTTSRCTVYRRATTGWDVVYQRASCRKIDLASVRNDVFILADNAVLRVEGSTAKGVDTPVFLIGSMSGSGSGDLFIAADRGPGVHKRTKTGWQKTFLPDTVAETRLLSGAGSLYALALDATSRDVLYRLNASGTWVPTTLDLGEVTHVTGAWVSPTPRVYLTTSNAMFFRSGNGWTKTETLDTPEHIWGRSDQDIYVTTPTGLHHWTGTGWVRTAFEGHADVISGTASDVLVGFSE